MRHFVGVYYTATLRPAGAARAEGGVLPGQAVVSTRDGIARPERAVENSPVVGQTFAIPTTGEFFCHRGGEPAAPRAERAARDAGAERD